MTAYKQALHSFLSQAGLPVYLKGQVPVTTPLPCAVCDLSAAPFGEAAKVTLTGWFDSAQPALDAAAFLDRAAALIPASGVKLAFEGGLALVSRDTPFLRPLAEEGLTGAQVLLSVRCYLP